MVTKEKYFEEITKPFFKYEKNIPVRYELEDEYFVPPKPKPIKFLIKKKPVESKDIWCQTMFIDRPMAMFEYKPCKTNEINDDWVLPPKLEPVEVASSLKP